jgi:hypothetical protein
MFQVDHDMFYAPNRIYLDICEPRTPINRKLIRIFDVLFNNTTQLKQSHLYRKKQNENFIHNSIITC